MIITLNIDVIICPHRGSFRKYLLFDFFIIWIRIISFVFLFIKFFITDKKSYLVFKL